MFSGYIPYVIADMGKHNEAFVEEEFEKFRKFAATMLTALCMCACARSDAVRVQIPGLTDTEAWYIPCSNLLDCQIKTNDICHHGYDIVEYHYASIIADNHYLTGETIMCK